MVVFKNVQSYLSNISGTHATEEKDLMSDVRYIRKSCALITEALQKGCDVMHMPNGDVIITEVRTLTYQYNWDEKKGKMVRIQSGARLRKSKVKQEKALASQNAVKEFPLRAIEDEDEALEDLYEEAV